MANLCNYVIRLYGDQADLERALSASESAGTRRGTGITLFDTMPDNRVYDAEVLGIGEGFADVYGTCAWSVYTSLTRRGFAGHLGKLGLDAVAVGSEIGVAFQERYVIADGELLVDDEQRWFTAEEAWYASDGDGYGTFDAYAAHVLEVSEGELQGCWCDYHEAYCKTAAMPCSEYLGIAEFAPEPFYELVDRLKAQRAEGCRQDDPLEG